VAGVYAPQAGGAVEDLPVVGRPVVHAFGAGEETRRFLELPVCRERHPEGGLLESRLEVCALVHATDITPFRARRFMRQRGKRVM
jgi:hypothetical protein